jgi:glycosyltransferase involved in cell wall biosynthesis
MSNVATMSNAALAQLTSLSAELKQTVQQAAYPDAAKPRVAVLLPCLNEAGAIAEVVTAFQHALPDATIYVYDNNSTDNTAAVARAAGAVVRHERLPGKGNVVRRMFADVDADIYVLADGDLTYDASRAGELVQAVLEHDLDMIVAARDGGGDKAYRPGHRLGNRLFNQVVAKLFGPGFSDIFSGYRAFSRRFVKSYPASASGFETEAELSIHALDLRLATHEVSYAYGERPSETKSKLRTYRDGARILWTIARMYYALHPLRVLGSLGSALTLLSLLIGGPVIVEFFQTGLVPRFPRAILAAALMQMSWLSFACGIIVQAISGTRREMKRMRYLELPSVR